MGKKSRRNKPKTGNKNKEDSPAVATIDTAPTPAPASSTDTTMEIPPVDPENVKDATTSVDKQDDPILDTAVVHHAEEAAPAQCQPSADAHADTYTDTDTNTDTDTPAAFGEISEIDSESEMTMEEEKDEDLDASLAPVEELVLLEEATVETIAQEVEKDGAAGSSQPRPIVIAGPSGAGKGSLIGILMKTFPNDQFGFSVSHTTRNPREGEVDAVHYNFTTVDTMKQEIEEGKFIEYANVHGNYYGTSVEAVRSEQSKGKICMLDIDVQGVRNVKKSSLHPYYIFVAPPSMDDLEARLRGRGTENEEDIEKRLANAQGEMDYGQDDGNFDLYLVNDNLDQTGALLCGTVQSWFPNLQAAVTIDVIVDVDVDVDVDKKEEDDGAPSDEASDEISEAKTEHVNNVQDKFSEPSNGEETEVMSDEIESELAPELGSANGDCGDNDNDNGDEDDEHPDDERELEPVMMSLVEAEEKTEILEEEQGTPEDAATSPTPVEADVVEEKNESAAVVTPPPQDDTVKQEDIPSEEPVEVAKEPVDESDKIVYTLEELKTPIDGVDWAYRENALSNDDFQKYFEVSRSELKALPKWKRQAAKKKIGLF